MRPRPLEVRRTQAAAAGVGRTISHPSERSEQPARAHEYDQEIDRVDAHGLERGRQDERGRCLDQPDQDAAGKGAEHAAEAAQRHHHIGDQRKGRAHVRVDIEEHCHDGAGEADQRGAEPPAEREDAVAVDADQRDGARILARRLQRTAEVGVLDEQV